MRSGPVAQVFVHGDSLQVGETSISACQYTPNPSDQPPPSVSAVLPGWHCGPRPRGPAGFCSRSPVPRLHRRALQKQSKVSVWCPRTQHVGRAFLLIHLRRNLRSLMQLRLFIPQLQQRLSAVNRIITAERSQLDSCCTTVNKYISKNRAGFDLHCVCLFLLCF